MDEGASAAESRRHLATTRSSVERGYDAPANIGRAPLERSRQVASDSGANAARQPLSIGHGSAQPRDRVHQHQPVVVALTPERHGSVVAHGARVDLSRSSGSRRHTETGNGVKHGGIRQGQIGGFTRTELTVDKAVVEAVHRACMAAGAVAVVSIKIPSDRKAYALDLEKRVPGEFTAENVVPMLNPNEPRYYFLAGIQAPGGPVFIYACPSTSPRGSRML